MTLAELRRAISEAWLADEDAVVDALIPKARLSPAERAATEALATELVTRIRTSRDTRSGVDAFTQEYALSSEEGVVLMCLAESLLRVPDAAIPRAIVEKLGLPITATSANLQGLPECNYATCVRDQIGDHIPLIVDGGATGRSVATTIVDLSVDGPWQILREGAIPTHEIALTLQR